MDFKKAPEDASAVGKLLTNARTCLYKSQTADFFGIEPPLLEEYLV